MTKPELTEEQIAANRTLGQILLGTGIFFLLFGLYVSAFLIPDVIRSVSGPQTLTMAEAVAVANSEQTYARLQGGRWDCDTLVHVEGFSPSHRSYAPLREETKYTEIFFTNDQNEIVAFVTLSGEVACADLAEEVPSGYLYAMSDNTREDLTNNARLARYFMTETFLEICGYCGRENSLIGAIFGVIFTVSGIIMIIGGRKMKNTYKGKPK